MRYPCKHHLGFTLIELLMVITLLGLLSGLVAPRLFRTYEKIQVQSEEKELREFLQFLSYRAFLRNRNLRVLLDKHGVYVGGRSVINFKYISFPRSELIVLNNGLFEEQTVKYNLLGKENIFETPSL